MDFKPQLRLPTDQGPNPYDSATPFQKPVWAKFSWWFSVIALGLLFGVAAYFKA